MTDLLLAYYGDDFTGSTDTMEALQTNGVPTVLFLEPPTPDQFTGRFADVRAVGIAGVSRSMSPAQMDDELYPKFRALKALGAPLVHYKVCSTFDSSPTIGSIGHAIEIGWKVFDPPVVPLVVGAPALRRYVVFGNLFARVGDVTYRLDRHRTMSRHPVTPMNESDLRLHLSRQTKRSIGLIDIWHMNHSDEDVDARFKKMVEEGVEIVLFDTIDERHLAHTGRVIWNQRGEKPVFIVGSSGIEYALTTHWESIGLIHKPESFPSAGRVEQLVVVSGSASPPTAEQMDYALARGFFGIQLDSPALVDPGAADGARAEAVQTALDVLSSGYSPLLYSAHGPDDPAIERTKGHMVSIGLDPKTVCSQLGTQQGLILHDILERSGLKRACVAGGDTSGYAMKPLGVYALEVIVPTAPGAPLCRASSNLSHFDGLEISLKGGQLGGIDYFIKIREGGM